MTPETVYEAEETIRNEWKRRFFEEMRSRHSDAVKRGMAKRAEAGHHLHRVPVGYRRVWRDEVFEIEPDPVQAPLVRWVFAEAGKSSSSVRVLVRMAEMRGLRKLNGKPLSISGLHSMLTNPYYIGVVRHGNLSFVGMHEALVERNTFDMAGRTLRERKRRRAE